jgi:hypothetical protein
VPNLLKVVAGALAGWFWLELREGWRSWRFARQRAGSSPTEEKAVGLDYAVTR